MLLPLLSMWDGFSHIDWHGSSRTFVTRLIYQLPHPELEIVLRDLAGEVGVDQQTTLDTLIQRLNTAQGMLNRDPNVQDGFHRYYKRLIKQLCAPEHQLDSRFVKLTLLIDKGADEPLRFVPDTQKQAAYDDLRTLLDDINEQENGRAVVLLGAPGSGKSTLLRHLQLQHAWRELDDPNGQVAFFVPLNNYRATGAEGLPTPMAWLTAQWQLHRRRFELPTFAELFEQGRVLLLLDGLNEMSHRDQADYRERIGRWQQFLQTSQSVDNTIVFSCRSLDYSAPLSSAAHPVRQVQVEPLSPQQIEAFLTAYLPTTGASVWQTIADDDKVADLFTSPFYARLLVDQVTEDGSIPNGAAAMITSSVRRALHREVVKRQNRLFQPNGLLDQRDYEQAFKGRWGSPHALPRRGILIPCLEQLAFGMQASKRVQEAGHVRVDEGTALELIGHVRAESLLAAGVQLNILNHDVENETVTFHHQLVQEYFAARMLARQPDPLRVQTAWRVVDVTPSLVETVAGLDKGTPLPALSATGWEETTLLAAAMAADPDVFVRELMAVNLPLAGRCAAAADITTSPDLIERLQTALVARLGNVQADLRARIAAAEALGKLGDPRWTRHTGSHGDYLLPPFVEIAGGDYTIGDDTSQFNHERPVHNIPIAPFEMAIYPVTNAEYALFMAAGGYEDEQWWQTVAGKGWLRGESHNQGVKDVWQEVRGKLLKYWTDETIQNNLRWSPDTIKQYVWVRNRTEQEIDDWIDRHMPKGKLYREPLFWNDSRFNSPNQPVVGISWHEAQAYCAWLSAQCGRSVTLPNEVEWEAAASGAARRRFAFGRDYHIDHANTFESHIRQTTPVGIYPTGATPNGIHDLSGDVWEWTRSQYRDYPYDVNDGRESAEEADARRTLRGGSWNNGHDFARAASRLNLLPIDRNYDIGFRVVCVVRPPSQGR